MSEPASTRPHERWALGAAIHLVVLWAFAVVQPTLYVLQGGPDLFVGRKVDGWPFVAVLLAYTFLLPGLLFAVEALVGLRSRRWRRRVHLLAVWALLSLFALYVLRRNVPSLDLALFAASAVAGVGLTWVYARLEPARVFLTLLAPAPLVFLGLFVFNSSSTGLIFPSSKAAQGPDGGRSVPVVVVVFDELPVSTLMDGHERIDAQRFPHFAQLARTATWYRNDITVADHTEQAVPALADGRRPRRGELPTFTDHPDTLLRLLAGTHRVLAEEHITWLCPSTICPPEFGVARRMVDLASAMSAVYAYVVFPRSLQRKLPPAPGPTWSEILASRSPKARVDIDSTSSAELSRHGGPQFESFLRLLRTQRAGERPPLYFLHSSLPHIPWNYVPSGKAYTDIADVPPGLSQDLSTWGPNPSLVDQAFQRHVLQAGFVDRLLGRLVARLKDVGLYDRALLVVTSDHGVSFHARQHRRLVQSSNAGDVGSVPLFIKAPGQRRGTVTNAPMQSIDLLPTVAAHLGVRVPWRLEGHSMLGTPPPRRSVRIYNKQDRRELVLPTSEVLRQRAETVARQASLFGTGGFDGRFYGLGGYRALVGRLADRAPAAAGARAALQHASDYLHVDPRSPYLPAQVSGEVAGPRSTEVHDVAVAIAGRVVATARTYREGGRVRFYAMVPDRALPPGRDDVEVYAASGPVREPVLARLGGTG